MIVIDGSMGEGGGQILRSALALSLLTGEPFRITNVRAGRAKPGLLRQHLAAVRGAAAVSDAVVQGAELGSRELAFTPGPVKSGTYTFSVGSAGSATLVFQTVLLPLLLRGTGPSSLTFEGGTHNPMAPPFDFIDRAFLPLLRKMGGEVRVELSAHGFYPAGGGSFTADIAPSSSLARLSLLERGAHVRSSATSVLSRVPTSVALRELDVLTAALGWDRAWGRPEVVTRSPGAGNVLFATLESEHVTEVFTAFGERGLPAHQVAQKVADEVRAYLDADVPVGEHLADQLIMPMALGAGGAFRTVPPSDHTRTQIDVVERFTGVRAKLTEEAPGRFLVEV
jgi:RNA 3'-terminal phosphate cyclase (ATP)